VVNNLLSVSANEKKIVDSGVLEHYIKLLNNTSITSHNESIQSEVIKALFTLSFRWKQHLTQLGCIEGLYTSIMNCRCYSVETGKR